MYFATVIIEHDSRRFVCCTMR